MHTDLYAISLKGPQQPSRELQQRTR